MSFKFISKKGITLIEVLIAVAIFGIVATVSTNILLEVVRLEKKSSIQNIIYEDAQLIMQLISKEIQNGTIDYEEYFSVNVIQNDSVDAYYGINYGAYSSRFYDPGMSQTTPFDSLSNPKDLGMECSYPSAATDIEDCEIVFTLSGDRNTGQNPFYGNPDEISAFCDTTNGRGNCGGANGNEFEELYLIDSSGTRKTIIAKKSGLQSGDYILSIMRMQGFDFDQNGVIDTFSCDPEFNCLDDSTKIAGMLRDYTFIDGVAGNVDELDIRLPQRTDLAVSFALNEGQFAPLSPLRSSIKDLIFIINPIENPYNAYAEKDVQVQPTVTIILTLDLSDASKKDYPGDFQPVTLQSNVAAGVVTKIDSYPPTKDLKWLKNLGGLSVID